MCSARDSVIGKYFMEQIVSCQNMLRCFAATELANATITFSKKSHLTTSPVLTSISLRRDLQEDR